MPWDAFTRRQHCRKSLRYASDMTDLEWSYLAPFMPEQPKRGRKRRVDLRDVINGIFYLLQTGCAWHLLPRDFPPYSTVYYYFKRFEKDGTVCRLYDALFRQGRDLEGREEQPTYAIIDSQSVKTGSDARNIGVGYDAGKKVKGRKRHIVVDILGFILKAKVHSAGIQDRDGAELTFDKLTQRFPFIEKICGDGGYQGPTVEKAAPRQMEIIKRSDKGFKVLPMRWIVERTLAWLTRNRRLAKDFERYPETSTTLIFLAMIKLMTRRLAWYNYGQRELYSTKTNS